MGSKYKKIREEWRGMKASRGFHNALVFLAFVGVAALFWLILALNDSVTETLDVRLRIQNVPDSVTFINDPPQEIRVTLRDKGTNLMRAGILNTPHIDLNFRDYAENNLFRLSRTDLNSVLKSTFGSSAQISSVSVDSLRLSYTTGKGRRIPIVIRADISAAPGSIISGLPEPETSSVRLYSLSDEVDTITHVYTRELVKRNLKETGEYEVQLRPIPGTKIVPSKIKVRIPVEPLVKKESMATVVAENVPAGKSLLLFPTKIPVSYYVPMSLFSSDVVPMTISVEYEDTKLTTHNKVPLYMKEVQDYVMNPELKVDSVEYTLVNE